MPWMLYLLLWPGAILLDLESFSLPQIVEQIVNKLIQEDQLQPEDRESMMQALLLKHK